MNRRYFLGALTSALGLGLARNSYASSSYSDLLDVFITPYTYQVGKTIITNGNDVAEQHTLKAKIDNWLLIDKKSYISKINELIDTDLSSSQFCEIDGWVITQTEALISAIIVGTA